VPQPPPAEFLAQLIAPERHAYRFIGRLGFQVELDGGFNGARCGGQRIFRLVMRGEQGFEALAQSRIVFAFGVEPGRALRSGPAQCQLEQKFFARWVHGLSAVARTCSSTLACLQASQRMRLSWEVALISCP